jgi:hypothetical protein
MLFPQVQAVNSTSCNIQGNEKTTCRRKISLDNCRGFATAIGTLEGFPAPAPVPLTLTSDGHPRERIHMATRVLVAGIDDDFASASPSLTTDTTPGYLWSEPTCCDLRPESRLTLLLQWPRRDWKASEATSTYNTGHSSRLKRNRNSSLFDEDQISIRIPHQSEWLTNQS